MTNINIAIYDGPGNGGAGVSNVANNIRQVLGIELIHLTADEIQTQDLSVFDVIIFAGGSGSKQAEAIGELGRNNVRTFVKNGGGYLGICAGAYLATAEFDWSLGIINAKTVSTTEWKRGEGFVDIEFMDEAKEVFEDTMGVYQCRYANGPILQNANNENLPSYTIAALFRTEVADNGTTAGVMVNTPAAVYSNFGKGKVFIVSPHPENSPGLENFVPSVLDWLKRYSV